MKNTNLLITLAVLGSLTLAGTAQAAGKFYIGGKAGIVQVDISGFDEAINAGVYGGFNMLGKDSLFNADLRGGTLAIEGEITTSIKDGETDFFGDWSMTSIGAYGAYRHPLSDVFYLKGKLGLVRYEIDTSLFNVGNGTETQLAAGIGAGWNVGPGSIEVELTTYESDALFLSGGYHFTF